jgi:hypothetical protein
MTQPSHPARRIACAVGFLLSAAFATPTWANVIYELHDPGTLAVIGTLNIAAPPASATTGWETTDAADLLALHLDDSLFGLGTGNLLSGASVIAAVLSLDGSTLDVGSIDISLPTIIPGNPVDPTINNYLSILFDVPGGGDLVSLARIKTFLNNSVETENVFLPADATVPEPATSALVMMGLAAAGIARRKRR